MDRSSPAKLLSFPNADQLALSIRAKAQVFSDPSSLRLLDFIERIAVTEATVLIRGETGTGKELVARHIHQQSRRSGQFVAVNCGSFAESLVESELFGHEAGAFTGAQQARPGWFEAANGGTLFLDEIGDLPLSSQVKLLRVLQEHQVTRIGSRRPVDLDVRLIAATNVDLEQAVQAGHFRQDLFYRLSVAPVHLPPLRERRGDILPLVRHFLDRYRRKLGMDAVRLSLPAERALIHYDWPGNIRELENVVHFALILCRDGTIELDHLRFSAMPVLAAGPNAASSDRVAESALDDLQRCLRRLLEEETASLHETVERLLVAAAVEHCGGNQVRSAKCLGISRNILRAQMKRFGLLIAGPGRAAHQADAVPAGID